MILADEVSTIYLYDAAIVVFALTAEYVQLTPPPPPPPPPVPPVTVVISTTAPVGGASLNVITAANTLYVFLGCNTPPIATIV